MLRNLRLASVSCWLPFALLSGPTAGFALELQIGLNVAGNNVFDSLNSPPDVSGAVGADHIVEANNGVVSVFRKSDGVRVQFKPNDQFWVDAGLVNIDIFDPRVLYDAASDRWFAVAVQIRDHPFSGVMVAVSATGDPTGAWSGFRVDADSTGQRWADFPQVGIDADGLYVSTNLLPITGEFVDDRTSLLGIPKTDLLAPVPTIANATYFENIDEFSGTGWFTQPIVNLDGSGLPMPLISNYWPDDTALKVSTVTGSIASPTLDTTDGFVDVDFAFPAFGGAQPGPVQDLEIDGGRIGSTAVLVNGAIWAVQTVDSAGRAAIRWFQIDAATNIVLQTGFIDDDTLDLYYPSVAVNPFDEVVIGFNGSSEQQFASSYAVLGDTVGGVTSFGDLLLLEAGATSYERVSDGRNRWGDYSSTVVDPDDPRVFWTFQEVVLPGNGVWGTQITQLFAIPEPHAILLLGTGVMGLLIHVRRRR